MPMVGITYQCQIVQGILILDWAEIILCMILLKQHAARSKPTQKKTISQFSFV